MLQSDVAKIIYTIKICGHYTVSQRQKGFIRNAKNVTKKLWKNEQSTF